jgi:hypothetical protein
VGLKISPEQRYDVVVDVLQKHYDKLWDMTKNNTEWGIMDQIRLRQMEELKYAMEIWEKHKSENNND